MKNADENSNTEHPLPVPEWSNVKSKSYKIESQINFDDLIAQLRTELATSLGDLRYDIVENVLQFYRHYKLEKNGGFLEIFKRYEPKLPKDKHDCIGLVLELQKSLTKLDEKFPNVSSHFFVASCQENLNRIPIYTNLLAEIFEFKNYKLDSKRLLDFDKEHVVLCFKFELKYANRKGAVIFDPGFHVGKVVIAMEDNLFPHTGWFVQKKDGNFQKLYEYSYSNENKDFIIWHDKTTKNGKEINVTNVIYTGRPFLNYLSITEKRNLVYFFKSLLSRDCEGHVMAGIYFKIETGKQEFTVLYQDGSKERIKLNFNDVMEDFGTMGKNILQHLKLCSGQLRMSLDDLISILLEVKDMLNDRKFVEGLLEIEEYITERISGIWSLEDPEHVYSP